MFNFVCDDVSNNWCPVDAVPLGLFWIELANVDNRVERLEEIRGTYQQGPTPKAKACALVPNNRPSRWHDLVTMAKSHLTSRLRLSRESRLLPVVRFGDLWAGAWCGRPFDWGKIKMFCARGSPQVMMILGHHHSYDILCSNCHAPAQCAPDVVPSVSCSHCH